MPLISRGIRLMSAFWGKADISQTMAEPINFFFQIAAVTIWPSA